MKTKTWFTLFNIVHLPVGREGLEGCEAAPARRGRSDSGVPESPQKSHRRFRGLEANGPAPRAARGHAHSLIPRLEPA
jgi:hypothetical protein